MQRHIKRMHPGKSYSQPMLCAVLGANYRTIQRLQNGAGRANRQPVQQVQTGDEDMDNEQRDYEQGGYEQRDYEQMDNVQMDEGPGANLTADIGTTDEFLPTPMWFIV